jgi:DNA-binding XRE family transcriptional regulator
MGRLLMMSAAGPSRVPAPTVSPAALPPDEGSEGSRTIVFKAGPSAQRRMRGLRERLGVTQTELGSRLGMTGAMIGHIESGKSGITRRVNEAIERLSNQGQP